MGLVLDTKDGKVIKKTDKDQEFEEPGVESIESELNGIFENLNISFT